MIFIRVISLGAWPAAAPPRVRWIGSVSLDFLQRADDAPHRVARVADALQRVADPLQQLHVRHAVNLEPDVAVSRLYVINLRPLGYDLVAQLVPEVVAHERTA